MFLSVLISLCFWNRTLLPTQTKSIKLHKWAIFDRLFSAFFTCSSFFLWWNEAIDVLYLMMEDILRDSHMLRKVEKKRYIKKKKRRKKKGDLWFCQCRHVFIYTTHKKISPLYTSASPPLARPSSSSFYCIDCMLKNRLAAA